MSIPRQQPDRCRCRAAYRGAINKPFVYRRGSGSGDRRRAYRHAPTAFCRGEIGVLSFVFVAAPAGLGSLITMHRLKPFLSGKSAKRCQWQSKRADFEEAPPLARLNRAREWQWRDGGQPEGYFLFGKRKYPFGFDGRRRRRRGRPLRPWAHIREKKIPLVLDSRTRSVRAVTVPRRGRNSL